MSASVLPSESSTAPPLVGEQILRPGGDLDRVLLAVLESGTDSIFLRVNERLVGLAFSRSGQNQVRAARVLGLSRNALRTCLKRHRIIR